MSFSFKMNKVCRIVFQILCTMGCVYQMFKLSSIYFSYETFVRFEPLSDISLPAVSIYHSKYLQLNDEILNQFKYSQTKLSRYLSNMTIKEQFEILKGPSRLLLNCFMDGKSCGKYLTKYIRQYYYCFTLFSQLNGEPDENYKILGKSFTLSILFKILSETFSKIEMSHIIYAIFHGRKNILMKVDMDGGDFFFKL